MKHECIYCSTVITPCSQPCALKRDEPEHICCVCDVNESQCELESRVVCENEHCVLKNQIDWYKIKLEEYQQDSVKMKSLINQFKQVNIGVDAWKKLMSTGELDITQIVSFVKRQRMTFDQFSDEEAYALMCLHEEFTKQLSQFLNEKHVKVHIKRELIKQTEEKLAKAQKIREAKPETLTKKNEPKVRVNLNPTEKLVLHHIKTLGMPFETAKDYVINSLKMPNECRNLKELGVI
jgi:hypothetical protein